MNPEVHPRFRVGRPSGGLDPFSLGLGALLLLAVSVVACVIPMLHATSVDPVIAVRVE